MQKDFHYGLTYTVASLAGFSQTEAEIIAYASAYVDDATNSGTIRFDNGAMFLRIASAHKMLDYRNFRELAENYVWIPFHFLPGNGGKKAGENLKGKFIKKLICLPDSYVAQEMIKSCIEDKDKPYALHRLGIALHVYADTWAHQGFAGVSSDENNVSEIKELAGYDERALTMVERLKKFFGDIFDEINSKFMEGFLPLGHGAALAYPDLPYLKWSYKNKDGETIIRDNPLEFLESADRMYQSMCRYLSGNDKAPVEGLPLESKEKIDYFLRSFKEEEEDDRHQKWLELLARGEFGFDPVELNYTPKGKGSWKYQALGTEKYLDDGDEVFTYSPGFLISNWKHFHDALLAHRFAVVNEILPRYGICTE